jgi:uncharacterized protein YukJ
MDNGLYQNGCLIISYPGNKWRAFFLAFQSQTFDTDEQGNPKGPAPAPKPEPRPKATKKKKIARRG